MKRGRISSADRKTLAIFGETFSACWACGWMPGMPDETEMRWPGLVTHHIAKLGRVNERWNLARLCHLCHLLAEGEIVAIMRVGQRVMLPNLTTANMLWLKRRNDTEHYDRAMLQGVWRAGKILPRTKKPARWFLVQRYWRDNTVLT